MPTARRRCPASSGLPPRGASDRDNNVRGAATRYRRSPHIISYWAEGRLLFHNFATGARVAGTIGFATLRGGSVIGEHSVILAGEGEQVTLSHSATDRAIFARGAITAALWARNQKPGFYSMLDVLGLS